MKQFSKSHDSASVVGAGLPEFAVVSLVCHNLLYVVEHHPARVRSHRRHLSFVTGVFIVSEREGTYRKGIIYM